MVEFFMNRLRRGVIAAIGLLTYAVGIYFQLKADIGVAPWNALNEGLSLKFNITFGTASIIVALVVIAVDLLMRERLGIGTFLDAFLVGIGTDICLTLDFLPEPTGLFGSVVLVLIGLTICALGQYYYMTAALSCGPKDSLLLGLGKRFPKVPIGTVSLVLLACVLICAIPLGGTIGIGTVICVFGTGIIMDFVFKIMKFEPRSVVHEGFFETAAEFSKAISNGNK
ncbi:MAG: hypothetical protein IJO55_10250 [Lachnospiraceae bacterium]|nr:hypothetical protein [Lachnospiraceae bacterium]